MSVPVTNFPVLHRFQAIGITLLLVMFTFLIWMGVGPLLRDDLATARIIAYAAIGVAATIIAVVILVLKPRVPARAPGQSVEQYWRTPASTQTVLLMWFLLEAGAVLAAVAFLLSGEVIAAVASAIAIAVFWMNGPQAFAKP